jgi:flagellar biosynthetic protein FliP
MENPDALKALLVGMLALAPEFGGLLVLVFLFFVLGCYIKLVTVLSIVRVGFGFSSFPAAFAVSGLALVLSCVIMGPLVSRTLPDLYAASKDNGTGQLERRMAAVEKAIGPWKSFLKDNADPAEVGRFAELERRAAERQQRPPSPPASPPEGASAGAGETRGGETLSLSVLGSAFIVTELREAFATALHLLVPFLVIELLVATLIAALGFYSLNPSYVSLPLKLIVFVFADGWALVSANVLATYLR